MRRIPRPSRAVDPSQAFGSSSRQRISPLPCRSAFAPCIHLRTSAAAFSTTAPNSFLLGKQDKKKHQQFVRRWQKRLLGESEPIGAHVDPYDPTSPVRIAPEEQGEYEEVLDEDGQPSTQANVPSYKPRDEAKGMLRVGGQTWLREKLESDMAKEFEKLTLRTYTPLTLDMANEIEEMTNTPYTLRDENLMMAQTIHEITKRPYTNYNLGLHAKVTDPQQLRNRFARAVAEVYALKQAGLDMDMAQFPNRGVYDPPRWIRDIKLTQTSSGDVALAFPKYKSVEDLLQVMQTAPTWEAAPEVEEELLVEEDTDLLEPVMPADQLPPKTQETLPTMDPNTPEFKRAAVVKRDTDRKPFDFMSNRPVPRAKPAPEPVVEEPIVEELVELQEPVAQDAASAPSPAIVAEPVVETRPEVASESRHSILETRAKQLADDISALRKSIPQSRSDAIEEAKWRDVRITDISLKFALSKRMFQLTSRRIPDPQLTSAQTLADLYGHLTSAAKPRPTSLFTTLHLEGQKARQRAKQADATSPSTSAKRKPDLGDLLTLGNVELRRVKADETERRIKKGLNKVVEYALWERGLTGTSRRAKMGGKARKGKKGGKKSRAEVLENGARMPLRPLSSQAAQYLEKTTKERAEGLA